jgi:hypothetical protein
MAIAHITQAEYEHWQSEFTKVIDGKAVRFRDVCVHKIRIGDCEDPDLFVAEPIWKWQESDAGQFIIKHAVGKPYWTQTMDHHSYGQYGHVYRIMARLSEQNETFWKLKWGNVK